MQKPKLQKPKLQKPKLAVNPKHPERICWGCDKYCSADDLRCGNGTIRTQHPVELFGEDWLDWELDSEDSRKRELCPENEVYEALHTQQPVSGILHPREVQNCYDRDVE